MIRLNLGCGQDIREGWENYDKYPVNKKVKPLDLNVLPLPFSDGYADEILLYGVYEHLFVDHYEFIRELSRILKPGGKLTVVVRGYRNIFEHEQCLFNSYYFNTAVNSYGFFQNIKCSCSWNTFSAVIDRLKMMLMRLFVREFKYEFTK